MPTQAAIKSMGANSSSSLPAAAKILAHDRAESTLPSPSHNKGQMLLRCASAQADAPSSGATLALLACLGVVRLRFGRGLVPVQHPAHHGGVVAVKKVYAEQPSSESPQISWAHLIFEFERVRPSDPG